MTTSSHSAAVSTLTERIGDAERDALVAELNGHHVHGRLGSEELYRRQDLALAAVTRYDLMVLVHDLPRAELPSRRPAPAPPLRDAGVVVARKAGFAALVASPVVGAGWAIGLASQYSSGMEVGFLATLVGGGVGYVTHSVRSRLRRG